MTITDEELHQDLKLAKKVITESTQSLFDVNVSESKRPYWAATQNLNYIRDLTKKHPIERAFTILGTSDNVFELINCGASEIIATDINPFAKYIFYLKKAAIKTLNVKEYISFILDPTSKEFFSRTIFVNRVINGFNSSEEVYKKFWLEMFNIYKRYDILNHFVKPSFKYTPGKERVNYCKYIHSKRYGEVKEQISDVEIELHQRDALELLRELNGTEFDWIDITNILNWVLQTTCQNDSELFRKYIKDLETIIKGCLNQNGILVIDYMFKSTNPRALLKNSSFDEDAFLINRINEIYRIIYKTLNDYFLLNNISYKSITSKIPGIPVDQTNDQLILAKLKK